jgi:hypothetical protein
MHLTVRCYLRFMIGAVYGTFGLFGFALTGYVC